MRRLERLQVKEEGVVLGGRHCGSGKEIRELLCVRTELSESTSGGERAAW